MLGRYLCASSFCFYIADSGVFGVPLQTLLDNDRRRHPEKHLHVPLIFIQVRTYYNM